MTQEEKSKLKMEYLELVKVYNDHGERFKSIDSCNWWLSKIDSILKARDEELIEKIQNIQLQFEDSPSETELLYKNCTEIINLIKNNSFK